MEMQSLEQLGRAIDDPHKIEFPRPRGWAGEVLHVDTYGNLVTNLPMASLPENFEVRLGAHRIPRATHYAAVAPGALLALNGSAGLLEISARNARAAAVTGARRGTPVAVEPLTVQ